MKKFKQTVLAIIAAVVVSAVVPTEIPVLNTSVEVQAATVVPVPKLVSAKAYKSDNKIKFIWEPIKYINKIDGYVVYRKIGNSSWKKVKTLRNIRSYYYVDSDIKPGTKYTYTVRAFKSEGGKNVYSKYNKKGVYAIKEKQSAAKPNFDVLMSSKTNPSTSVVVMLVTNKGSKTLRIYSKEALLIDAEYESYCRHLTIIDPDEADNNRLVPISYIDVAPKEEIFIPFLVNGSKTWYDKKSAIGYKFKYDGTFYYAYSNSYYGTKYEKE